MKYGLHYFTALWALSAPVVYANTEKAVFVAPPLQSFPVSLADRDRLDLLTLTPSHDSLRISLPVAFPTDQKPRGRESWYLLQHLYEAHRYEVRVCWAAVQPTTFWVDLFDPTDVLNVPELSDGLTTFIKSVPSPILRRPSPDLFDIAGSNLLLRIQSAADFFSSNDTLMQDPPAVDVDIILDPYLANIFPRSLVATAGYLALLAIAGYYLSAATWTYLQPEKPHNE